MGGATVSNLKSEVNRSPLYVRKSFINCQLFKVKMILHPQLGRIEFGSSTTIYLLKGRFGGSPTET